MLEGLPGVFQLLPECTAGDNRTPTQHNLMPQRLLIVKFMTLGNWML